MSPRRADPDALATVRRAGHGDQGPPLRSHEAMALALDWAEGRLSHNNRLMSLEPGEPGENRQQTMVAIYEADAIEAKKWAAVAVALCELEVMQPNVVGPSADFDSAAGIPPGLCKP